MIILFSIIAFHLLAILAGRTLQEVDSRGITILIILTLLLVSAVLFGIFTMEYPNANELTE